MVSRGMIGTRQRGVGAVLPSMACGCLRVGGDRPAGADRMVGADGSPAICPCLEIPFKPFNPAVADASAASATRAKVRPPRQGGHEHNQQGVKQVHGVEELCT